MARILYGNFDFEHELESPAYRPSARLQAIAAQLTPHLIALAEDGDFLWSPIEIPREFLDAAAAAGLPAVSCAGPHDDVPPEARQPSGTIASEHWGCSAASLDFARQHNWSVAGTDPADIRRVNDRGFAARLEAELDCGLPGSRMVSSHEDLLEAIRSAAGLLDMPEDEFRWVVKSRFGMASRGHITGTGTGLDDPSAGWLWKQFDRNGEVLFEPWVECDREFSTQWVIAQDSAAPVLRGWTETQAESVTPSGWLCAAGVPIAESDFHPAMRQIQHALERLADEEYSGPVGIDSMLYRISGGGADPDATLEPGKSPKPNGSTRIRPLQDINARYTMGRVALELSDRLAPNKHTAWLLLPGLWLGEIIGVDSPQKANQFYSAHGLDISEPLRAAVASSETQTEMPDDAQAWLTSPLWIGNERAHRCGVLISSRRLMQLTELFRGFRVAS